MWAGGGGGVSVDLADHGDHVFFVPGPPGLQNCDEDAARPQRRHRRDEEEKDNVERELLRHVSVGGVWALHIARSRLQIFWNGM